MLKLNSLILFAVLLLSCLTLAHSGQERYGGIGLEVAQLYDTSSRNNMGTIVVLNVLANSPAQKAGIEKGDLIMQIDEEPTIGKQFENVILNKLRGPIGSEINLSVKRAQVRELLRFKLKREKITFDSDVR